MNKSAPLAYYVIEALTIAELEQEVNRMCTKGWKPTGGVAVVAAVTLHGNMLFYQAMVIERNEQ